jgi:hypothetical protein
MNTTHTIAPHKDGFKIIASWTEHRDVNTRTRHAFRAVAQTSVVYFCKTMAEAEKEAARLQARKRAA